MAKRLLGVSIAAVVLGASSTCWADLPERLQPLTEFVAAAGSANADNREAASVAEQRAAEVDVAWGRVLPAFTARGAYTRNQVPATAMLGGPGGQLVTITPSNQLDGTLTLDVPLIDIAGHRRVTAASTLADAAGARGRATRVEVTKSLSRQYFQLLAARALILASSRTLAATEANAAMVAQRRGAGLGSELDVDRASAEVERSRQSVAESRYLEALASRALRSTSGLTPAAGDPADASRVLDGDLHEEAALERWEQGMTSPLMEAALLETRAAEQSASAARAALLPVVAGVAQERFTNATGFTGRNATWTAGVFVTWRFDVGTVATIQAQNASERAAEARAEKARTLARDRVHDDWQLVSSTLAKSRAARAQVHATEHGAKLARERYASGLATHLEVVQAERDAFSASVARIQSDTDLAYARAALRLDAGRSLESH